MLSLHARLFGIRQLVIEPGALGLIRGWALFGTGTRPLGGGGVRSHPTNPPLRSQLQNDSEVIKMPLMHDVPRLQCINNFNAYY